MLDYLSRALVLSYSCAVLVYGPRLRSSHALLVAALLTPGVSAAASMGKCLGGVDVTGTSGQAQVIRNTGCSDCPWPVSAPAEVTSAGEVLMKLTAGRPGGSKSRDGSRVYLGAPGGTCATTAYNHSEYAALQLLGKTLSFDVNLSAASCGCNVAFYLVAMAQNTAVGNCDGDYYCDANNVCNVRCVEIDIMEANRHAFHTTAHTANDGGGSGAGLGGGERSFTKAEYGLGGSKVDTTQPFSVHTFFQASGDSLGGLEVTLQQPGKTTIQFSASNSGYLSSLSSAVRAGLTPVMSYWSSDAMRWLDSTYYPDPYDGSGADPCPWDAAGAAGYPANDNQDTCGEHASFSGFGVTQGRLVASTKVVEGGDDETAPKALPKAVPKAVPKAAALGSKADSLATAWASAAPRVAVA